MEKGLKEFVDQCIYRLEESSKMINKCLDRLSEEEVWKKPNTSSNAIGNLLLHLCGNVRQYAISSLGNTPDVRQRDQEFLAGQDYSKAELSDTLARTIDEAKLVMKGAPGDELLRKRRVQGFDLTGIGIIVHVTEHFSYHTGQVALLTKLWKNQDLGFYAGVDLNIANE